MRIRNLAAVLTGALTTLAGPASAQHTGDQSRLVFTVSAAYVAGADLWHVPDQPVRGGSLDVARAIEGRGGAAMAATYFKGAEPRSHRRRLHLRAGVRRRLPAGAPGR